MHVVVDLVESHASIRLLPLMQVFWERVIIILLMLIHNLAVVVRAHALVILDYARAAEEVAVLLEFWRFEL